MKKTLLKGFTVATTFFTSALFNNVHAQTIPNGGFENWQMPSTVEKLTGGWFISDEAAMACNPATSIKSTDAASGSYSLLLQTSTCSGNPHEGWALGTFPISTQPMYLNFKYKAQHAGPDSAHVYIRMNKWNGTSRQKLLEQTYYIKGNHTTYQSVSMPLNYLVNDVPDTVVFDISSDGAMAPVAGNQIWIDDLSFSLTSDLPAISELSHTVFPNPATGFLNIRVESMGSEELVAEIHDITGRMLARTTEAAPSSDLVIHVGDMAPGIYFYTISQGNRLGKGKFVKR